MGSNLSFFSKKPETMKPPEEDFDLSNKSVEGGDTSGQMSIDRFAEKKLRTNPIELYRLYRQRLPYLIEDYLGINMNYYTSIQIPNNLIVRFAC